MWARSRFAVTEVETEYIEQFFSVRQKRKPNAPKSEHSNTCIHPDQGLGLQYSFFVPFPETKTSETSQLGTLCLPA